jgi:hypothetical protein
VAQLRATLADDDPLLLEARRQVATWKRAHGFAEETRSPLAAESTS